MKDFSLFILSSLFILVNLSTTDLRAVETRVTTYAPNDLSVVFQFGDSNADPTLWNLTGDHSISVTPRKNDYISRITLDFSLTQEDSGSLIFTSLSATVYDDQQNYIDTASFDIDSIESGGRIRPSGRFRLAIDAEEVTSGGNVVSIQAELNGKVRGRNANTPRISLRGKGKIQYNQILGEDIVVEDIVSLKQSRITVDESDTNGTFYLGMQIFLEGLEGRVLEAWGGFGDSRSGDNIPGSCCGGENGFPNIIRKSNSNRRTERVKLGDGNWFKVVFTNTFELVRMRGRLIKKSLRYR